MVNMRSTVALTLAALAFGAATAHNTVNEHHVTEVDILTVDCTDTDEAPLPTFAVHTSYSTLVHQSVQYTLCGGATIALPTEVIEGLEGLTSIFGDCYSTGGQKTISATTSTSVEEQPTASSAASTASTSTGEEPIVSTAPAFTTTKEQSTFVTVPVSSESVPAIVSTSSADAHSEASTAPAPTTTAEQASSSEAIVPPVATTETPLINPLPSVTPSDTPTTTSVTLTTTETLPGAPIPPVMEGVPPVVSTRVASSHAHLIENPSISSTVQDFTTTTKTLTQSRTTVVTVILNPTQTPASAEDCLSTTYVTVYSPPSPPAPVTTAPNSPHAIFQNATIVNTGVPHPVTATILATGVPQLVHNTTTTTNTTTGQTSPPIHGAAPTLSATPGLLLAFCGLICYLI
ncbi:hypothetical protein V500_07791 [Pseudogymnoascus sp. VKM F-4518 (FW-2643)]|nr:hypothetical protein V500_07791 [Pseudogymnoascus sp. VKM F-4518 (FW-2643)]